MAVIHFQSQYIPDRDLCLAIGRYITKHGKPSRDSNFIRWEIKVNFFLHRPPHVLLFSEFIEVMDMWTGRLDQVIEGMDIGLLYTPSARAVPLVAWRGEKNDEEGLSEQILGLIDTTELTLATPVSRSFVPPSIRDECQDM
jgi:RHO1 GDP-GTP exchange protein 1/2